jgi:hypothetical protein
LVAYYWVDLAFKTLLFLILRVGTGSSTVPGMRTIKGFYSRKISTFVVEGYTVSNTFGTL